MLSDREGCCFSRQEICLQSDVYTILQGKTVERATVLRPCLSHILSWWCGGRRSLTAALVLVLLASGNKGHY